MDTIRTESLADNGYKGREIRLCQDGKYRWVYELNMYTNPAIFLTVYKIFFWIIVVGFAFFALILYVFPGEWDRLPGMGLALLVALGGFFVLTLLGYLIVAAAYKGKYAVLFEMGEKEVVHTQLPQQFKKAQKMGFFTALVGLASKRPATAGAGLMAAGKQSSTSVFRNVRSVKPRRWMNLIKVNQLLNRNQVYVSKEDFDFVYEYIRSRCPQAHQAQTADQ